MSEKTRDERKKIFDEIMESMNEYSTKEINDLETAEYEIVRLLKTHRAVKRSDYEYGLSRNLIKNHRLIIKEPQDGSRVREYMKNGNNWYCALRGSSPCKCKSSNLFIIYGIVFAPINHNQNCVTREYSVAMVIQDLIKHGNVAETYGLVRRVNNNPSTRSSSLNSNFNESTISTSTADQNDHSAFDEFVPENTTAASGLSIFSPPSQRLLRSLTATAAPIPPFGSSVRRQIENDDDDGYCMIVEEQEPAAKRARNDEQPNVDVTFEFYRPSTFLLKKVSKTFNITNGSYNDAYKLWSNISFYNIIPFANNIQTHPFKSPNIFACLSLLFTAKTDSCFLIQYIINEAFRKDPVISGTKSVEEIEEILINNIASDEQIEFIAKFLGCRIGIYYDKILMKLGKWENHSNDEEDVLTLILAFENEKNHRLIIKEPQDGSKVREFMFIKRAKVWRCISYNRKKYQCRKSNVIIKYGIVFASLEHSDGCETKEYSFVMKIQDLLKHGKTKEAQGLAIHGGRSRNNTSICSPSSSTSSIFDESTMSTVAAEDSIFDQSISENTIASVSSTSTIFPPNIHRSTPITTGPTKPNILSQPAIENFIPIPTERIAMPTRSIIKREAVDDDSDDCCMIIEEPVAKKPKIEVQSISDEVFEFYRPSSFLLKNVSKKFNIINGSYNDAYKLWANMNLSNIIPVANAVKTHFFKSPNIFPSLSLLFTGKTDSCFLIQYIINEAFRKDPVISATKTKEEIEQILINGTGSEEQIEFIAKFLECRIGIYYGKILKKFGKWENQVDDENILTLILSFENGVFSIVLNLD